MITAPLALRRAPRSSPSAGVGRCHLSQEGASPRAAPVSACTCCPPRPGPPQTVLGEPDTCWRGQPLGPRGGLGPSRGLAPGSHLSHKVPAAWGGAAAHLAESHTPGQGVVPASKPLIPALGRRVPKAGQEAQVFPAHLQITPHPNRHPRDRWRRRRASHGAWPRVDWLLGSARGRDRVVSP